MKSWKFPGADQEWATVKYSGEIGDASLYRNEGRNFVDVLRWDGDIPELQDWGRGVPQYRPMPLPQAPSPWGQQVGGSHYTDCPIQPFQYSMANGLDPMQHTIVKYVTRFRSKNGIADLKKARHTIDLLIAWEEQNAPQPS